jgi:hypothetical protein
MMDEIRCDVEKATHYEETRIKQEHGEKYHTWHEAYGVLAEEVYETNRELETMKDLMEGMMRAIHRNDADTLELIYDRIAGCAIRAACELIQVAAVCRKALGGVEVQDK